MRTATLTIVLILLALLAAPVSAQQQAPVPEMEIYCERGVVKEVKIYSSEPSLTFRCREKDDGISGLFGEQADLDRVRFDLYEYKRIRTRAYAITSGIQRRRVTYRLGRRGVPGCFRLPSLGGGRYLLIARRKGYLDATVIIHKASFAIVDLMHSLSPYDWEPENYAASFGIGLFDPDEEAPSIPLRIESLNAAGQVIDRRDDVEFRCEERWPARYKASRRIRISTAVVEGFAERLSRRAEAPLPAGFFEARPLRVVWNGFLRISFRNLSATYNVPLVPPRKRPVKPKPGR